MIDFDVAFDKLAGLETADEIADYLISCGVKAIPQDSRYCAISNWMGAQTGVPVMTNRYKIFPVNPIVDSYGNVLCTPIGEERKLTNAMSEFTRKFDGREYPELIHEYDYEPAEHSPSAWWKS